VGWGQRGKEENLVKAAKLKNINSWHFSLRPSSQPHDLVSLKFLWHCLSVDP
jgi:hypothetical protein